MNSSLDLIRLQDRHHPAVTSLQVLYEEAFPAEERRSFSHLLSLLKQPDMHLYILTSKNEVAGLCIYWDLERCCFLEHLAIVPAIRGQGLGQKTMKWLLAKSNKNLVLEVERPRDEVSRKRIRFYQELLGFTLYNTFNYHQPPYQKSGQPVPLYLMSAEPFPDQKELQYVADHIKQQVYERFYK